MTLFRTLAVTAFLVALTACSLPAPGDTSADGTKTSACTDTDRLTVMAGSELKELEPALVQAGQQAGVCVQTTYAGTLDMVDRVNDGEAVDALLPPNGREHWFQDLTVLFQSTWTTSLFRNRHCSRNPPTTPGGGARSRVRTKTDCPCPGFGNVPFRVLPTVRPVGGGGSATPTPGPRCN